MEFIFATHNDNKVKEVLSILANENITLRSLKSIGYTTDIEETGTTLDENAWIKTNYLYNEMGGNIIAEDTGLEVDALDGAPGVYSARYAGPQKDANDNMDKLLEALADKADRGAQFRTVVAMRIGEECYTFEGIVRGVIASERMGDGGFGYDPIFIPEGYDQSFGQLSAETKNDISHRGRAFQQVRDFLANK